MPRFTEELLSILYPPRAIRRHWRDQLSDWLLDLYEHGHVPTARDLLDGIFLFRPALLEILLAQPHLKDGVLATLNSAEPRSRSALAVRPVLTQQ